MLGISCSHWGILLFPDEKGRRENMLVNSDGSVEKLDDDKPMIPESKGRDSGEKTR